jgi:hypothetical protein
MPVARRGIEGGVHYQRTESGHYGGGLDRLKGLAFAASWRVPVGWF